MQTRPVDRVDVKRRYDRGVETEHAVAPSKLEKRRAADVRSSSRRERNWTPLSERVSDRRRRLVAASAATAAGEYQQRDRCEGDQGEDGATVHALSYEPGTEAV